MGDHDMPGGLSQVKDSVGGRNNHPIACPVTVQEEMVTENRDQVPGSLSMLGIFFHLRELMKSKFMKSK